MTLTHREGTPQTLLFRNGLRRGWALLLAAGHVSCTLSSLRAKKDLGKSGPLLPVVCNQPYLPIQVLAVICSCLMDGPQGLEDLATRYLPYRPSPSLVAHPRLSREAVRTVRDASPPLWTPGGCQGPPQACLQAWVSLASDNAIANRVEVL